MNVKLAKVAGPTIALSIMIGAATFAHPQESLKEIPLVLSADMPLYPLIARAAHVVGTVRIKVKTNGESVASLTVISGPPMLVEAAKKNIQTWKFSKHEPLEFVTTFEYELTEPARCTFENGTAIAQLPLNVHIAANTIQTCDPSAPISNTQH